MRRARTLDGAGLHHMLVSFTLTIKVNYIEQEVTKTSAPLIGKTNNDGKSELQKEPASAAIRSRSKSAAYLS